MFQCIHYHFIKHFLYQGHINATYIFFIFCCYFAYACIHFIILLTNTMLSVAYTIVSAYLCHQSYFECAQLFHYIKLSCFFILIFQTFLLFPSFDQINFLREQYKLLLLDLFCCIIRWRSFFVIMYLLEVCYLLSKKEKWYQIKNPTVSAPSLFNFPFSKNDVDFGDFLKQRK